MSKDQMTFGWEGAEDRRAAPLASMAALSERLARLAERRIYLGTSSWKYPGWLGRVYDPIRYLTRGKFSRKKFLGECLTEYASHLPTVCGDFAFYQFPSERSWAHTFGQMPTGFRFCLKIPEDVTVERFPDLPRYGKRAGLANEHFMDSALVRHQLLNRLEPYRDRLGVLIFEFGTIHGGPMSEPEAFTARLDRMLSDLPVAHYQFAVEVRNPEFLVPRYFDTLRAHRVAHCFNSWTRMPPLAEQIHMNGALTASHAAVRALLRPGRSYQAAVEQFSPYERIQDPYPEGRAALHALIETCLRSGNSLYLLINNRFEGNAIQTIEAVIAALA